MQRIQVQQDMPREVSDHSWIEQLQISEKQNKYTKEQKYKRVGVLKIH